MYACVGCVTPYVHKQKNVNELKEPYTYVT